MPKRLYLSAVIELPDDLFDSTEVIQSVKVPWYAALQNLKEKQVQFTHSQEVTEVRAKAKRGPRKTKLGLVPPPAGEAA
jgi:hypothetical protein